MIRKGRTISGPYGPAKQIGHAQKNFHEPNQGGIVNAVNGKWYFLTHHGSSGDWSGRNMSLLPVNWVNGWPILGKVGTDTIGNMVWAGKKPVAGRKNLPQSTDEFNQDEVQQQWEWNYQPRAEKFSLKARKGWLRLWAFKPLESDNLLKAGNTLTQRTMRTTQSEVTVKLDLNGMADGQKCGITHFGAPEYSSFGVAKTNNEMVVVLNLKNKVVYGPQILDKILWLKSTWGSDGLSQYYYSTSGTDFIAFGDQYQMKRGSYRGDRIGIFNYNNDEASGYVDVDYFRYTY